MKEPTIMLSIQMIFHPLPLFNYSGRAAELNKKAQ